MCDSKEEVCDICGAIVKTRLYPKAKIGKDTKRYWVEVLIRKCPNGHNLRDKEIGERQPVNFGQTPIEGGDDMNADLGTHEQNALNASVRKICEEGDLIQALSFCARKLRRELTDEELGTCLANESLEKVDADLEKIKLWGFASAAFIILVQRILDYYQRQDNLEATQRISQLID